MPTAKKLKSGSWRCQVVDHYEYIDGKRKIIRKSFTVHKKGMEGKRLCERMASDWLWNRERDKTSALIGDAVRRYIGSKENILSESTLRSYRTLSRNAFEKIENVEISSCTAILLQGWINDYAKDHSPKTVKNAYGLLSATAQLYDVILPKVTLPKRKAVEYVVPTDADIKKLLEATKGTDMELAIMLAAFGTLRLSEICALTAEDIKGNTVTVNKAFVRGTDGYVLKNTKTYSSTRMVELPASIISELKRKNNKIVELLPSTVTKNFIKIRKRLELPEFRFHDLRHYSASVMAAHQIPRHVIEKRGGWKAGSSVLQSVYINVMPDSEKIFTDQINAHFEAII